MASKAAKKKKKKTSAIASRGFGKKDISREFTRAEGYMVKGEWRSAYGLLQTLGEQYPTEKRVWMALSDVCRELEDFHGVQFALERWVWLEPREANALYALGATYMVNQHLLLALKTFRQALAAQPDHEEAEAIQEIMPGLEAIADEARKQYSSEKDDSENSDLENEDWWDLAILHERGQVSLEAGDYDQAKTAETEVLRQKPDYPPAQNNLSLIAWMTGEAEQAISTAKSVLDHSPNNIHALSNLVRFYVVSGDEAAAREYAKKLKQVSVGEDAWKGWAKKLEGLSYLGDDEGALEVYEQWVHAGDDDAEEGAGTGEGAEIERSDPLFNHLAAVALSRCDRLADAQKHWTMAAKGSGRIASIAQQNLKESRLPIGERHGAWPFLLTEWLLPKANEEFQQILETFNRTHSSRKMERAMQAFFDNNPVFIQLIPRILERGGPEGQTFLVISAGNIDKLELKTAIKDFALGQNGSDQLRQQASSVAVEAGLIPRNEKVTIWVNGEWQEVTQLSFEIYEEAKDYEHAPAVKELQTEAVLLLREQNDLAAQEAETFLKEALEVEPDAPDLQFNLAAAYLQQGKTLQGEALIQKIHKQSPDYLFARTALAKFNIDNNNYKAARDLLEPLQEQTRFHVSEFDTLMDVRVMLAMAQHSYGAAETWLNLWEQQAPEHPRVMFWRSRLALTEGFDL